jgi:hypothetical protein
MKSKTLYCLVVVFVIGLNSIAVIAQSEEQAIQPLLCEKVFVKPSKINEFISTVKEIRAIFVKYKLPYTCYVHCSQTFQYLFCWRVQNFSDIENFFKTVKGIIGKYGDEKWLALWQRQGATTEYRNVYVLNFTPALSFSPEDIQNQHIWYMQHWYVQPEHEKEFREICKEWVDLYERKNIPVGYDIYEGSIGTDIPVYSVLFRGVSLIDILSKFKKVGDLGGEEAKVLRKKMESFTRKMETEIGEIYPLFADLN